MLRAIVIGDDRLPACNACGGENVEKNLHVLEPPAFLAIELQETDTMLPALTVSGKIELGEFGLGLWTLGGAVYLADGHFTSRVVDNEYQVWSHDGVSQSNCASYTGDINETDLLYFNGRRACWLIYTRA